MKIMHVIPSMDKGGAERYVADVCTELSSRPGIEVMIVSMSEKNAYSFITGKLDYRVCHSRALPSITGKGISDTAAFEAIVNEFKPDLIHSHLFHAELMTRERLFPGVAYVTTCQNNMPEFQNFGFSTLFRKDKLARFYEKRRILRQYKKCNNHFIAISKDTLDYYRRSLPSDLQDITLLYHAINFERFHAANHLRTTDTIRIIYVARFADVKNHRLLVEITGAIKAAGLPVETVLLGQGELMEEVKAQAKALGLDNNIRFEGNVNNVEDYLREANFYIHPAYYEPFGLVIIEAMAAGLPVICLDGKGNRDLIVDGSNGYMFYRQDPGLFAAKVKELASDKALYGRISANATAYAKDFSIEKHTDNLLELYTKWIAEAKS